jgi:vancomycin resistance protein YoaR
VNVGGGVSQLATTLYNAVFFGGYEDVEHRPHSIYFSRYPVGREATVVFPKPDVVFRNDTLDPVRIDTSYTSSSVTVRLYGNDMGRSVSAGLSGSASTANGGTVKVTRTIRYPSGTVTTQVWWHTYNPKPDSGGGGGGGGGGGDPEPDPDPGPGPGPSPD